MSDTSESMKTFSRILDEADKLGYTQILLGLLGSAVVLVLSTWGVLSLLNFAQIFVVDLANLTRYTTYMILGSVLSTVIAVIIVVVMVRWPRIVNLPLRIHRFLKRASGEYFLSPEPADQSWGNVIRRSLYGSILVVGISLSILNFSLLANDTATIILGGPFLMLVSIIVLPITLLEFYFGPWLIKDSGLFYLDERDRSLSNVGDDLEDILEFFAGIDILFILLELTFSMGLTDPWVPIFVILIPLGPLFSIVLNFTIIFMIFKKQATASMIEFLSTRYEVPDILTSPDYIRSRVVDLVDRDLLSNHPQSAPIPVVVEDEPESDPIDETPESIAEDDS